jgi:hypothetical protein
MPDHPFQLRAAFRYSGDDNRIDGIDAEILTAEGWNELEIGNASPGFLIFVYSFLICQHTYFRANSGERGLLLENADVELYLHAGEDWKIDRLRVAIAARLRSGDADQDTLDYIRQRMRLCPVSINLDEPADYRIDVEFG